MQQPLHMPSPHDHQSLPWHEVLIKLITDEHAPHIQLDAAALSRPVLLLEWCHAGDEQHAGELNGTLNIEVHMSQGVQELTKGLQRCTDSTWVCGNYLGSTSPDCT